MLLYKCGRECCSHYGNGNMTIARAASIFMPKIRARNLPRSARSSMITPGKMYNKGDRLMLEAIFAPQSVAIVGASPDPKKLGHRVLRNVVDNGYSGRIIPIHPTAPNILDFPAYASVVAVPDSIDLAVIVVPPQAVLQVVEECGKKGVRGLVVITAGFKEIGGAGKDLERKLIDLVQRYGMRMIGPNCLGIIDTTTQLNASFAALMPNPGQIAFMSQSGALCTAILDWSKSEGIGFSRFVSLGNKGDVDEVVLLQAWGGDPENRVILAYLEGISDGAAFIKTAREVTKRTPVIAIKSGTTQAGTRAISSHTGSLAGSENAYQAAFNQSGILRANTMEELFDYALAFAYQPLIAGKRLAIVTNAGGPGIIATDAAERSGLTLAQFTPETIVRLQRDLPPAASYMGAASIGPALQLLNEHRIPNYAFPERAVAAFRAMARQRAWTEQQAG